MTGKFEYYLRTKYPVLYSKVDKRVWQREWVFHSIHYGKGGKAVLNYLSRYVHRSGSLGKADIPVRNKYRIPFRATPVREWSFDVVSVKNTTICKIYAFYVKVADQMFFNKPQALTDSLTVAAVIANYTIVKT